MVFSDRTIDHKVNVCVIGGGLAGICAAVSASRHGAHVLLMHDRPVLGGNASSEIRMWVRGAVASGTDNRETGIIQEIELENIYRNPTLNYSIWDTVLYQSIIQEKGIELLLNCSCLGCESESNRIKAIKGWQLNSYTFHTVEADIFIDCSGDSILAPLSGAIFRMGREGATEFDEYGAERTADSKTMGSSVLLQARETDHPCSFTPPEWAYSFPDDESMHQHAHRIDASGTNFWWIELGGEQNTLEDAQKINEELIKITYGVWDHLKNHGDHGLENWELEWIGFLPGKRESRRYTGPYVLSQKDLEEGHHFKDSIAYGGWTMDNHSPMGFYFHGYSSHHIQVKAPYEIPLRCLYSLNIENLMFAGRNISATHMALSSTRVMGTCAVLGQAAGTGAAMAVKYGCNPDEVDRNHMREVQAILLDDGCFIPGIHRTVGGPTLQGIPTEKAKILGNGWERPQGGNLNSVEIDQDEVISFSLNPKENNVLRIATDIDFPRETVTDVPAYRKFALRSHIVRDFKPLKMPAHMLRSCVVEVVSSNGKRTDIEIKENRRPVLFMDLPKGSTMVELKNLVAWSDAPVRLFSCDVMDSTRRIDN